jgi:hypothetical protein
VTRKSKTTSDKIRALFAAGVTDSGELARRTGASRQLVHAALARSGQVGRPAREVPVVKLSIAVPAEVEEWLREQATRGGCSLGDVVADAVERARAAPKKGAQRG